MSFGPYTSVVIIEKEKKEKDPVKSLGVGLCVYCTSYMLIQ